MTVSNFDPNHDLISLSDEAALFLKSIADKKPDQHIRLSIKTAGCSGYAYMLDFVDSLSDTDISIKPTDTITIAISREAAPLVRGTELYLEEFGLNKTIKYKNPNVTGECGCGESFSVS